MDIDLYDWKHQLQDKLTDEFIQYQWNLDSPYPTRTRPYMYTEPPWNNAYRNNALFHAKVQTLVAGVMGTIIPVVEELMEQVTKDMT